jgi:hypothetical protein
MNHRHLQANMVNLLIYFVYMSYAAGHARFFPP